MELQDLKGRHAVSYARWSSGKQGKGSSLKRQSEQAVQFCERAGMRLDLSIVDKGVSAFTGDNLRAGLGAFLDKVRSGEVPSDRVLLLENLDRFSRQNPEDVLPIFMDVLKTGMVIVTLQDGIIHSSEKVRGNAMHLIPSLVAMQLAQDESKKKSERLKASWSDRVRRVAEGERLRISKVPFWIDQKTQKFNGRADDAKTIFVLAEQGLGATALTKKLNEMGVASPRGGTWGRSMVQDVLASKSAFGTLTLNGVETPDYFPPLVSETRWLAIRNAAAKQRRNPQAATNANLFPRLLKCKKCGSPMNVTTTTASGKKYRYAVCAQRAHKRGECDAKNWPYDDFEHKFVHSLGIIVSGATERNPGDAEPSRVEELSIKIESLTRRHETMVQMIGQAEAQETATALLRQADGLAKELEVLRKERAALKSADADASIASEAIADLEQASEEIERLWKEDRSAMRNLIASVVDRVDLYDFDPDSYGEAEVRLKTGEVFELTLEGSRYSPPETEALP